MAALKICRRLRLHVNYHDHSTGVYHGPDVWRWWRLFAIRSLVTNPDLGPQVQHLTRNVWFYRPGKVDQWGEPTNRAWLLTLSIDWRRL